MGSACCPGAILILDIENLHGEGEAAPDSVNRLNADFTSERYAELLTDAQTKPVSLRVESSASLIARLEEGLEYEA